MSFLKNSLNFSLVNTIKEKYLYKELQKYNEFFNTLTTATYKETNDFVIIPNNNNKYYCFIIPKHLIDNKKSNYSIMYFFPKKQTNEFSDFFIEADMDHQNIQLYEGYMYENDFLLTDVLIDNKVVKEPYNDRFEQLKMNYLNHLSKITNGNITIAMHNICRDINAIDVFIMNFKNTTNALEYIYDFKKVLNILNNKQENETFIIRKTNTAEIYDVIEKNHNTFVGVLYIKTLSDSQKIRKMFETNTQLIHECKWNNQFKKWQLI